MTSPPEPIDAAAYADTERRLARLLDTSRDVLLLQGEAILVLEAAARGVGGPGVKVLNCVSGPYGELIGDWIAAGGAEVVTLAGSFDAALRPAAVRDALAGGDVDLVSVVHAEAATGVVNPLAEIAAAAHETGAAVLVDAVASVGAEPLHIDEWDLDLVALGPQKAIGGPAGVCALVASEHGWAQIESNPHAPRSSILSLMDWKQRWIDAGRQQIPGYAYEHEMRAMRRALSLLDGDVRLSRLVERHHRAALAVRGAAPSLGLEPWIADDGDAAAVVTLLRPPDGISVGELLAAAMPYLGGKPALLTAAPGPLAGDAVRVNHTGPDAEAESVLAAVGAIAMGLHDLGRSVDPGEVMRATRARLARDSGQALESEE